MSAMDTKKPKKPYPKNRKMRKNGYTMKKMDRDAFFTCMELLLEHKVNTKMCAEVLGVCEPTFRKRACKFLMSEIDERWFFKDDEPHEDGRWIMSEEAKKPHNYPTKRKPKTRW